MFDEYKNVVNDRARRIYLFVCALNRMNVPVRAGLIYRLTGVSFNDFKHDFFAPLESIVLSEEYKPALDMAYRARHPWVAQIVFERALPNERDRFDLYMSILKEIDVGYTPDRSAFREAIRARNLKELFSDPLLVEEIFRAADDASHNDGYLFQQHAIYEMRRLNGRRFDGAISRLESDHAWVTPYGQHRGIFLHCSQVDPNLWQRYRQGDALRFGIGFNYMGPAVTFRGLSP